MNLKTSERSNGNDPLSGVKRVELTQGWQLCFGNSSGDMPAAIAKQLPIHAAVPGCVHTDLLAAGLIEDPYIDQNDRKVEWIGKTSWRYVCSFEHNETVQHDFRVDLVCEGLDTLATIKLNGKLIATTDNMHRSYRFDVGEALHPGRNELTIDFAAPLDYVQQMLQQYPDMAFSGSGSNPRLPHCLLRKMACNFGWDWGPVLLTAGIWRPIYIESWRGARIDGIVPEVLSADPSRAVLQVNTHVLHQTSENPEVFRLRMKLLDPAGRAVAEGDASTTGDQAQTHLEVANPQRWWPVGYGDQPLYTLRVELLRPDDDRLPLDVWVRRVGLREVELVTDPDPEPHRLGQGATFHFRVNGQRVFAKGANWIPDDCFPSRITADDYQTRVRQAVQAGMNMLRVWGGGIYEDHAFYDACDELGVLVWQDFCCACATYPETEPYLSNFEAEARDNVLRLASHASLSLWCGNNECQQAVERWGGNFPLYRGEAPPPWGKYYYEDLFPRVVAALNPTRAYWPGSPASQFADLPANDELAGDAHLWDVWNRAGDARQYLSHTPRFASEFGFHGPPTWPTLSRAIPPQQRRYDSPAMVHHNRHVGGQPLANERLSDYFDPPDNFDDWCYLAQVMQARSLAMGIEWFRALSPWCSGTLFWQFNDCWPVSSWAAIDGDGRPKPLWYATRRFYRPRLVTLRPANPTLAGEGAGSMAVYLHNDHGKPWRDRLVVQSMQLSKALDVRPLFEQDFEVEPRGLLRMELPSAASDDSYSMLVARTSDDRAFWYPKIDRELAYPTADLRCQLNPTADGYLLRIEARSFVRDLCVFPDRIDPEATIDDQLLTMLPGEVADLNIQTRRAMTLADLTDPTVLQTINRFGQAPNPMGC